MREIINDWLHDMMIVLRLHELGPILCFIQIFTDVQLTLLVGLMPKLFLVLHLQPVSFQFRTDILIFFSEFFYLPSTFLVRGVDAL